MAIIELIMDTDALDYKLGSKVKKEEGGAAPLPRITSCVAPKTNLNFASTQFLQETPRVERQGR